MLRSGTSSGRCGLVMAVVEATVAAIATSAAAVILAAVISVVAILAGAA